MREIGDSGKPIVLLGGGHAHLEVVRRLGALGLGRRITLVSPSRHAPYSGMLPGYIAGHYRFADLHVDLLGLCEEWGATFAETSATGIDPKHARVTLANGRTLEYDRLSIDIGSVLSIPAGISGGISVKPIAHLRERLDRLDASVAMHNGPFRLAVVGQGVAGVEVAFALRRRLAAKPVQIMLVGRADKALAERSRLTRLMIDRELRHAGIMHVTSFDVIDLHDGELAARDGRRLIADEVVWATSSGAPAWLGETGLDRDADGFIRVDHALRTLSDPKIFAAGDIASLPDPRPKAGVFAVRQGPVLAENIRRSLSGTELLPFRPQRQWLALISLGDGRAIADKWGMALSGRWVARWKHRIDTRFLRRYARNDTDQRSY